MAGSERNVARALGEGLARFGVRHVFGVVGSGNFELTSALVEAGARFTAARHETAAVAMADGHARVTHAPAVATVHQGPGYTNALTGMTEAAKAGSGVLLVAADTPDAWTHSNFRVDQAALARAAGIAVEAIDAPGDAAAVLERAWARVANQRQATVLLLPLDVQRVVSDDLDMELPIAPPPRAADEELVEEAARMIAAAERPVVIAGRGAVLSGSRAELEQLAADGGALLATSLGGHGLFAGNEYALGISGGFATDLAVELISAADLIVGVGASLNRWTMRSGRMRGPTARAIAIDVDPARPGDNQALDLAINGDARLTGAALRAVLARRPRTDSGYRTPEVRQRIATGGWREQPFEDCSSAERIDPRTFSIALDATIPAERTVVLDGGHHTGWPAMYLGVPDADGFVPNQSFQSIGLGIASAIGSALARPDRLAVATVGDGGTFMALGELDTAVRIGMPLVVCVYNDDAYGAEVHHFGPAGGALDIVRFPPTDLAAVGRAMGADGLTVRKLDDLLPVREWLARLPARPLVIDVKVVPDVVGKWLPEAFHA